MIYLTPFVFCAIFYILREENIISRNYIYFMENIKPKIPISSKVFGSCIFCTSFWWGLPIFIFYFINTENFILFIAIKPIILGLYNSVVTTILTKLID